VCRVLVSRQTSAHVLPSSQG